LLLERLDAANVIRGEDIGVLLVVGTQLSEAAFCDRSNGGGKSGGRDEIMEALEFSNYLKRVSAGPWDDLIVARERNGSSALGLGEPLTLESRNGPNVRLYAHFTPDGPSGVSSSGGVAGRPFRPLKYDLLLQIGPSVSDALLVTS
jgi:hypothetical protein